MGLCKEPKYSLLYELNTGYDSVSIQFDSLDGLICCKSFIYFPPIGFDLVYSICFRLHVVLI